MRKTGKRSLGQILLRLLFVVYGAAMLWLLFGQRIENSIFLLQLPDTQPNEMYKSLLEANTNLTPLYTIKLYLRVLRNSTDIALLRHAVINLVGNVVMFIPLGVFLPGIFIKRPNCFKVLFAVALMIIFVELIQLFSLLGSCDIDDLILNLSGASIGYGVWKLKRRKYRTA